ncbi:MAG: serine/threonine-protein kinase, partial [Microcystaceae cyanobacterium]
NRIALSMEAHFIVAYPWGYLLANRDGRCLLLDDEGFHVGQFDLKEPITAIAAINRYRCLVALWQDNQGSLIVVDLGDNLDEIIEEKRNQD